MSKPNSVIEAKATEVTTNEEGMTVTKLESPDRLKQLREQQRAIRLETAQVKEALKKQAEAEKAAKLDSMSPEERQVALLMKSISAVSKSVKDMNYTDAFKHVTKLRKEIEAAAANLKTEEAAK